MTLDSLRDGVQTAVMARLSEEIAQAAVQTKEKRDRLELARRARRETAAAIQANVDACANSVNIAVAVHSAAVEHFAATNVAAEQPSEHVATRSSSTALSEDKRDTRVTAVTQLEAEQAQACSVGLPHA